MNPTAIAVAESRLRNAQDALERVKMADGYEVFADNWFIFLCSWKGIYNVLEQGAKTYPLSVQWFEGKRREKRSTPVLHYLYQARNSEEHGLDRSTTPLAHEQFYEFEKEADGTEVVIFRINPKTGNEEFYCETNPVTLVQEFIGPSLVGVKDRKGRTVIPPIAIGGQTPDMRPIAVAQEGLAYVTAMIDEARLLSAS